jgi:hypothetical protein
MKTASVLLLILNLAAIDCFSQGNLQFNRVVKEDIEATVVNTASTSMGSIMVPAGKVLKIESVSYVAKETSGTPLAINSGSDRAYIGNHVVWNPRSSLNQKANFPIWLPEGTHTVYGQRTTNSLPRIFSYSGIEFNVVP